MLLLLRKLSRIMIPAAIISHKYNRDIVQIVTGKVFFRKITDSCFCNIKLRAIGCFLMLRNKILNDLIINPGSLHHRQSTSALNIITVFLKKFLKNCHIGILLCILCSQQIVSPTGYPCCFFLYRFRRHRRKSRRRGRCDLRFLSRLLLKFFCRFFLFFI